MKCSGCTEEYIGETGDLLRKRVTVHRQQIRDPNTKMLAVSGHIDSCAESMNPNFTIFPLFKMNSDSTSQRKAKEDYFIKLFKPSLNSR